jgi:hypothetical protein
VQLRRKLASTVSQYQQEVSAAAAAAGASLALAAAVGATVPLNTAGERSKPLTAAAVSDAAADAAARAAPAGSSAAAAGLEAAAVAAAAVAATKRLAAAAAQRGWEGAGSQGTELVKGTRVFRVLAVMSQVGAFLAVVCMRHCLAGRALGFDCVVVDGCCFLCGFESGSRGTELMKGTRVFWVLAVMSLVGTVGFFLYLCEGPTTSMSPAAYLNKNLQQSCRH